MVQPFTPKDAHQAHIKSIPQEVLIAINELLSERFNNQGSVTIKQKEIIERATSKMSLCEHFNYDWLDFEPIYRASGWTVKYDKPHYTENYDAYFEFTPKDKFSIEE